MAFSFFAKKKSVYNLYISNIICISFVFLVAIISFLILLKQIMLPYYYRDIYKDIQDDFIKKELVLVTSILKNDDDLVSNIIKDSFFIKKAEIKRLKLFNLENYSKNSIHQICEGSIETYMWGVVCKQNKNILIELPIRSSDNTLAHLFLKINPNINEWSPYRLIKRGVIILVGIIILSGILFIIRFYKRFAKPVNETISYLVTSQNKCNFKYVKNNLPIFELAKLTSELEKYHNLVSRNEALASIGQSAAMIAHDVRKPLAAMKSLIQIFPEKKDDEAFIRDFAGKVDASIDRTNSMLDEVLEFSKDATSLKLDKYNPQSIITSALGDAMRGKADLAISIDYDLNFKNCLHVDGNRIIRVLTNIIGNAVEAMNGKGKLWIHVEDQRQKTEDQGPFSDDNSRMSHDAQRMTITIGNNGPIIPEEVQKRLFDPFFTKGKKGGTGLGLSICQKIVEMHGGTIEVKSSDFPPTISYPLNAKRYLSTEFTITLPSSPGNLEVNERELIYSSDELKPFIEERAAREDYSDTENTRDFMKLHKEKGRSLYMLIVDDEPLFRETVRTLLGSISQVKDHVKFVETDSAEKAMEIFKAREFDYVIADIDLGKNRMNGYEMAKEILQRFQNTRVVIHSNKRREEMDRKVRDIENPKFMGFLPKPMSKSELLQFLACKTFEVTKEQIAASAAEKQARKKVLIVNDDDTLLLTFKIILKSKNVDVKTAINYEQAIEEYKKQNIDIILSDINLGDVSKDGYDFLKAVREENKSVPFYMVSGYSQSDEEPKAKQAGATGYLQLPINAVTSL